jgi:hypothetical protein
MSPDRGDVDPSVQVYGEFFTDSEVRITFDGQQVATARPDTFGEFSISFRVPALDPGEYAVKVGDVLLPFTVTQSEVLDYDTAASGGAPRGAGALERHKAPPLF